MFDSVVNDIDHVLHIGEKTLEVVELSGFKI